MNNNRNIKSNILIKSLFGIYCILVIWIILFKFSLSLNEIMNLDKIRDINLIPFYYANDVGFISHFEEVFQNFLIFIPLGIYLKMLNKENNKIIFTGFIFSLILELSQFVFGIGATDITDLITNTLGCVMGVWMYCLLEKEFINKDKINNVLKSLSLVATVLFCLIIMVLLISN